MQIIGKILPLSFDNFLCTGLFRADLLSEIDKNINGISLSFTRNVVEGKIEKVMSLAVKFSLFTFFYLGASIGNCGKSLSF